MIANNWLVGMVALIAIGVSLEVHASGCEEMPEAQRGRVDAMGVHLGNGGDVLVHRGIDGAILSAGLLDFYESETQRGITRDLGDSVVPTAEKIEIALKRIERLDRGRAQRYRDWYGSFMQESCFLSGVNLVDIPDSQHVQLPAGTGWAIEQIAVQQEPRFPEDRRYFVNEDLWNVLDNDSRAGLILHELMYRDAIVSGTQDSVGVRYLLSVATSTRIDEWDFKTYVDRLVTVGMGDVFYSGVWLDLKTESIIFEQGKPAQAYVKKGTIYKSRWGDIPLDCRVRFESDGEISAFSLGLPASRDLIMQVGHHSLELSPPWWTTLACNEDGHTRWDVVLSNPGHPDEGLVYVTTRTHIPVSGPSFESIVTGGLWLEDGELLGGRNDPLGARTHAVINGQDCVLDWGTINFAGGPLGRATLTRCAIPIWRSTVYAVGEIGLVTEEGHLQPLQVILEADQPLKVGFGDSEAIFKGGTMLTVRRPDGKIKIGTLASDAELCGPYGQMLRYFAGMQLEFDESGCVSF